MKIRYTAAALAEQRAVLGYIKERSPGGARKVAASIRKALERAVIWPLSNQATDDPNIRRAVATPYAYVIFYEPTTTEIIVHRVRHTSRDPEAP